MCVCVRLCVCVCACVCLLVPDIVLYCVPCVREGPHLTYTTSILPVPVARLSRAWAASYWPTSQTSNCFDTWRRSPRRSSIQGCGVGRAIRTTAARSASGRRLGCVHTPHRLSNVALRALSRRFYQPLPLLYTGGPVPHSRTVSSHERWRSANIIFLWVLLLTRKVLYGSSCIPMSYSSAPATPPCLRKTMYCGDCTVLPCWL